MLNSGGGGTGVGDGLSGGGDDGGSVDGWDEDGGGVGIHWSHCPIN